MSDSIAPDPFDPAIFSIVQDLDLGPLQTVTLEVPQQILDFVDAYYDENCTTYSCREQVFILGAIAYVRQQREYDASPEGMEEIAELRRQFHEACDKDD